VENGGVFTVKSTYWLLANLNLGNTAKTEIEPFVIHRIWKCCTFVRSCRDYFWIGLRLEQICPEEGLLCWESQWIISYVWFSLAACLFSLLTS